MAKRYRNKKSINGAEITTQKTKDATKIGVYSDSPEGQAALYALVQRRKL